MADIIKIKAKKQLQWQQDNKFIFVKIPLPGHNTIKNVEIFLADLILRITSKQKKFTQTLDLFNFVDYLSPDNKFVLIDGVLNATLKKKQPTQWENLSVDDISLAELKNRRKQSQTRYEQNIKEAEQLKDKLKNDYDRKATQQLMRFEAQERKKLQKKKEDEKQAALNQVFNNVNEKTGKIEYTGKKWEQKGAKALEELQKQQQEELQRQKQVKKKQQQQKYMKQDKDNLVKVSKPNDIFTEQDVAQYENIRNNIEELIQQIPIRKEAKVNVKFTEKLYPLVATRDYHYTQPPKPKDSAPLPPTREGDLQNRNPLWLKDKGDGFMRMKNYTAALDAYNEGIKIDPTQRKIVMNRSLTHIKLLNIDSALYDIESVLLQMQKQLVSQQDQKSQSLIDLVKLNVRKAQCFAMKGELVRAKDLFNQQLQFQLPENIKQQIKNCILKIQQREESVTAKTRGDECVKRQAYAEAIHHYDQAIQIDENEYALSNKSLCLNKISNFVQALEICDRGIKTMEEFTSGAFASGKSNPQLINLFVKILYRKSTAQQSLGKIQDAQSTLQRALGYNPQQKDIKNALSNFKNQKQALQFLRLKQEASQALIQKQNPTEALALYAKCLKLVESPDKVQDYLSVLQNQCVCYLKLEQFDSIIAVSIRILNIVNNLKAKIVEFGGKKNKALNKQTLDKIQVRTLVRRANAYLKTGQVYNAKSDLQKAAQIDPKDQNVAKQLEKLKQSLGTLS